MKYINKIKEKLKEINYKELARNLIVLFVLYLLTSTFAGIDIYEYEEFIKNLKIINCIELFFKNMIFNLDFVLNYFILVAMYLINYGISGRKRIAMLITIVLSSAFSIMDYFVTQIRGIGFTLPDIYSIRTALNVAKGIKVSVNVNFFIGIFLLIFSLINCYYISNEKQEEKKNRIIRAIVGIGILFIITNVSYLEEVGIWDVNDCYKCHGPGLTLIKMAKDLKIQKPKGYNKQKVKELLDSYKVEENDNVDEEKVNIIIVMNESFADLSEIYNIDSSADNMPFYHSLKNRKNTVVGKMHSSQYGGGTANVEYEFLTRNATAFLPVGAMPYQQYIKKDTNSAVSYMNSLNYKTIGIHSWYKTGYSRGKIYKYLGFDKSLFKEDMNNLENEINEYSSDISTYKYVIDELENKEKDESIFEFVVTMQNHLPYIYQNDNGQKYVDNIYVNNYLQVQNKVDNALKYLIDYIEKYDEKTIVLFFGDHQPNLNLQDEYGIRSGIKEDEANYIVPYFITANYDINLEGKEEISTNYLESLLMKNTNLKKDSYSLYMEELNKEIPIITNQYYIDKDGNKNEIDDKESKYYDKLQEYQKVVYYKMFDE